MGIGWDGIRDWVKDFRTTTSVLTVCAVLVFLKNEFAMVLPWWAWAVMPVVVLGVLAWEIVKQFKRNQREMARVASELSKEVHDFRLASSQQFLKLHRAHGPINFQGQLLSGVMALGPHGFKFTLQPPNWSDLERRAETVGLDPEPLRQVKGKSEALILVIQRANGGQWIDVLQKFGLAQTEVNTAGNECHRVYDGVAAKIRGEKELPIRIA